MNPRDLQIAIELHDVSGIKALLNSTFDLKKLSNGKPLLWLLIGEYTRSSRFKDCVKVFLESGFGLDDPILESVLSDDSNALKLAILNNPEGIHKKHILPSAYTPFFEVSLLHICAEFNHVSCAEVLVNFGLDINSVAGIDEIGFEAQTPIFHTVNQNSNQSKEMLDFCLENGADLKHTVRGLIWGKGYPWETLIPAVNPISYAMMGLLPQMHRSEEVISMVVSKLLNHQFGIKYSSPNVPNKYLRGSK